MATATMAREVSRLRATIRTRTTAPSPTLDEIRRDPANLLTLAGMTPDPWQRTLLRSNFLGALLLCSRQSGKSLTAAALALRQAMLSPGSLVLLLSPSLRQSAELFRDKIMRLYRALRQPIAQVRPHDPALRLELVNGSRIISLPGSEETIRGYSGVSLLVVDEASRVPDALNFAIRPMLAVSRGKLVALSTPFGKRGWFFEAWQGEGPWNRVKITAAECPRIDPGFLREEREALGERWFRQEYDCSFEDAIDAVFAHADILAAMDDQLQPLFS